MVPAELSDPHTYRSGRLVKLWYGDPAVHFEAQILGPKWAPSDGPALEVGLHLEAPAAGRNDRVLGFLNDCRSEWGPQIPAAEAGRAIGPRAATWRRVSEIVEVPGWDEDFAGEVAERLARYVRALGPRLP